MWEMCWVVIVIHGFGGVFICMKGRIMMIWMFT